MRAPRSPLEEGTFSPKQQAENRGLGDTNLLEELLAEAEGTVGLSDWGGSGFHEPLQRFLWALAHEAHLTPVGERFLRQETVRLLCNRLQLQAEYARLPVEGLTPLQRPLFVVGLFRSGTSLLHNLLTQDPAARWLHLAEALYPVPAPVAESWAADPRLAKAEAVVNLQNGLAPDFIKAHAIAAHKPAECSRLFEHSWIGHLFDFRANVPSYSHWLLEQPLGEAYQAYHRQLQYLSGRWTGSHWALKAPAHLYALDALAAEFPTAAIVHLHRNPLETLPSCCSLTAVARSRFSSRIDPMAIGDYWLQRLPELAQRAALARQSITPTRILDVEYTELLRDPSRTVRAIYEYFGYEWSERLADNLARWVAQNPQHQHGAHRYTLEQFGLTPGRVLDAFAGL